MISLRKAGAVAAFALVLLTTPSVIADDWTAVKLRGVVVGLFDGEWVKLQRGAVIPDDQPIRTLASGRVTFQRDGETIDIGPNTQIQIFDRAGQRKHTTVRQYFGRVAIEAEVREVTHFSVQTPHLAAVVKGTRFVVVSGEAGARVDVERGAVTVRDTYDSSVTIVAGQQAVARPNKVMTVAGRGKLPVVLGRDGKPLKAEEKDKAEDKDKDTDKDKDKSEEKTTTEKSKEKTSSDGEGDKSKDKSKEKK